MERQNQPEEPPVPSLEEEIRRAAKQAIPATWQDLEPTVGQERTEAQQDGFRYDYDDNI
ncbi:hypothetical protein [Effusibacillus consociatus]|uniref:Uncharacterized protein n=1 Tax=Effusibacillus consociatus TaxID=1117041 RepID=A0ABV9PWX5_9BACL